MGTELKNQLMQSLFRFRKTSFDYVKISDLNMTELFVLSNLMKTHFNEGTSVDLTQIQSHTYITKAAISKMFTSLEKKGYVIRETDKTNRRKITVEITPCGKDVIEDASQKANEVLDAVFTQFGADNTHQLISLLNSFSDITEDVKKELGA